VSLSDITTLAFDADDTLWGHEAYYQFTQEQFALLLAEFVGPEVTERRLLEVERRNLAVYGYGVKSFTLSMIETALEVTEGRIDGSVVQAILDRGRDLLAHPIEPLEGVRDTLVALTGLYRLIVITKGDLFDQERKLAQSGLGEYFDAVDVVSEKTPEVYERLFARHGHGAARGMMIGNSLKSDILPALAAGAYGVHVPSSRNWALDHADAPEGQARFMVIDRIADLVPLLDPRRRRA
jgi:putative hydrolase of the HAD superfamily